MLLRITSSLSWTLFFGCIGIILGIALASWISTVWGMIVGIFGLVFGMFWLTRSALVKDRALLIGVFLIAVVFGVGRYWHVGPDADSIANEVGKKVVVEGRIIGVALKDDGVTYTVDLLSIDTPVDSARNDRLLVEAPISAEGAIGDRIRASCVLEEPRSFDGFAYDRFLAAKSIYAICRLSSAPFTFAPAGPSMSDDFYLSIGVIHEFFHHIVQSILPEPQATLLLGLLMGEDGFSATWKNMFRVTGTSHIVAASGYNVAVVAELSMMFLVTVGLYRRQAFPLVIFAIGMFVVLAGGGAAVIRAGAMGSLVLIARHVGRHTSSRNIIAITVATMLLLEPRLLRDDVGFQLSVAATIGLIVLTDRIASLFKRIPTSFGVRESLASTLAATVATLPITLASFRSLSVIAPLVNVLVLPFVPLAMMLGAVAIFLSSIFPKLGIWIALPAWTVLVTITEIIGAFGRISWASVTIPPSLAIVFSMIGLVVAASIIRRLHPVFERDVGGWRGKHLYFAMMTLCVLFVVHIGLIGWRGERWKATGVRVWVFDVGQGDGIYIDGIDRDVVIDGGPTRLGMVEKLATVRFPWERAIGVVIVTHPHADHIMGLIELMKTYSLGEILDNGMDYAAPAAEAFREVVGSRKLAVGGDSWSLSTDATLKILWPPDATTHLLTHDVHARSVIALLTVGERTMLLTGDAESLVEAELIDLGHVDVLKVGHHGSDTSTSEGFLQEITPSLAIISVGSPNSYGHPSPFVMGRLEGIGAQIFRTDRFGDILLEFRDDAIVVR